MADDKTQLNFVVLKQSLVKAICHNAVDSDQNWNVKPVKLRPTKEFLNQLNRTTIAILLRSMDNACLYGRTSIRPEDIPTLKSMGLDHPEDLGVQIGDDKVV